MISFKVKEIPVDINKMTNVLRSQCLKGWVLNRFYVFVSMKSKLNEYEIPLNSSIANLHHGRAKRLVFSQLYYTV